MAALNMAGIFVSYRRDDSAGYAGRLYDLLCAHFGAARIFMDLEGIKAGDDFVKVLKDSESQSAVLLAVIGKTWLSITGEDGQPRLSNPADFVRLEVASGLRANLRVIPVLVGGARMPAAAALPEELAAFAQIQAVNLEDAHFHRDVDELIAVLDKIVSPPSAPVDIAGTWRATVKYGWGDTHEEVFTFELDDDELLGTASYVGAPRAIQDAKITGNKISFLTKSISILGDKSYEEKHQYSGKLIDGQIKFRLQTETGYDTRLPETFIATRSA